MGVPTRMSRTGYHILFDLSSTFKLFFHVSVFIKFVLKGEKNDFFVFKDENKLVNIVVKNY